MPTRERRERRDQIPNDAVAALAVLRKAGVWMTAWAVAQEMDERTGRQVRYALELTVADSDAEYVPPKANRPAHYRATR